LKRYSVFPLAALAFAWFLLAASPSWAKGVDIAYVGPTQLYAACQKAGGDFSTAPGTYGCTKDNCDGKGGTCAVACGTVDKKCVGMTPGRIVVNETLPEFLTAAHVAPLLLPMGDDAGTPSHGTGLSTGGASTPIGSNGTPGKPNIASHLGDTVHLDGPVIQ